jgi:hypothetical protein
MNLTENINDNNEIMLAIKCEDLQREEKKTDKEKFKLGIKVFL